VRALRQAEAGQKVSEILSRNGCIAAGVLQLETALRWIGTKRVAAAARGDRKPKTLVADLTLDKRILQEALSKKV
jgi:hypothetical protein